MDIQKLHDQVDKLYDIKSSLDYIAFTITKEPVEYSGLYHILIGLSKQIDDTNKNITLALKS